MCRPTPTRTTDEHVSSGMTISLIQYLLMDHVTQVDAVVVAFHPLSVTSLHGILNPYRCGKNQPIIPPDTRDGNLPCGKTQANDYQRCCPSKEDGSLDSWLPALIDVQAWRRWRKTCGCHECWAAAEYRMHSALERYPDEPLSEGEKFPCL